MRSRSKGSSPFSLFAFQDIITSVTGIMILITMMMALELVQNAESAPRAVTPAIAEDVEAAVQENEEEIRRLERILSEGAGAIQVDADTARRRLDEMQRAREELERQNASLAAELNAAAAREDAVLEQAQDVSPETLSELRAQLAATQKQIQEMKESNRVIFNRPEGTSKTPWLVQIEGDRIVVAESEKAAAPRSFASTEEFLGWAGTQNASSIYFVMLIKPAGVERFVPIRETLQSDGFDLGYDLLNADQTAIDPQTGAGIP